MLLLKTWILSILIGVLPPHKLDTAKDGETVEEIHQRYDEIANDLAYVLTTSDPLFRGAAGITKTTALMISVSYYESTLRKAVDNGEIRGDGGRSWCLMQINVGDKTVRWGDQEMRTWTGPDLVQDRRKCFRAGLEALRASMSQCRQFKPDVGAQISGYIHGPRCKPDDERSGKRWVMAKRIYRKYTPPPELPTALAMGG